MNNNKELEWLNIENKGMKYIIKFQPRIVKEEIIKPSNCDVISNKNGMITKIISSKGVELVEQNDIVNKDDILISGEIKYNDEIKNYICAEGEVYAKTWYKINISTTKYYENVKNTKRKRYNLIINNKKIFKEKYINYNTNNKKIINIFNLNIYLSKEQEIEKEYLKYDEETLNNNIEKLIDEKLSVSLNKNYKIIERNVLKKVENNSKIDIEYFIVAEELISTIKIIE